MWSLGHQGANSETGLNKGRFLFLRSHSDVEEKNVALYQEPIITNNHSSNSLSGIDFTFRDTSVSLIPTSNLF
jgi:hypothetical protein